MNPGEGNVYDFGFVGRGVVYQQLWEVLQDILLLYLNGASWRYGTMLYWRLVGILFGRAVFVFLSVG